MPRYRKKPIEVDAIQFTNGNSVQVAQFITNGGGTFRTDTHPTDGTHDVFHIHTLEGEMRASDGDWIVKGIQGEFHPVKPDIFEATYETAQTPQQRCCGRPETCDYCTQCADFQARHVGDRFSSDSRA
ncbi:hypothetical protein ACGFZS_46800 [Streptomyces sp. NPDC048288]|uniref:hypothetical protein n=1 Tax=Streptomyces sp. NPDC048288 TaxID=3365529 RepID=UPI00371C52F6